MVHIMNMTLSIHSHVGEHTQMIQILKNYTAPAKKQKRKCFFFVRIPVHFACGAHKVCKLYMIITENATFDSNLSMNMNIIIEF